jgi:hypothetical protein
MQLTKSQFRNNLVDTLKELLPESQWGKIEDCEFIITPCTENNVKYNSRDDNYKRWMLNEENLKNQVLNMDGVVNMLSLPNSSYPLWINVSLKRDVPNCLFELQISLRIRTPTQLKNIETGHPPFKAMAT